MEIKVYTTDKGHARLVRRKTTDRRKDWLNRVLSCDIRHSISIHFSFFLALLGLYRAPLAHRATGHSFVPGIRLCCFLRNRSSIRLTPVVL